VIPAKEGETGNRLEYAVKPQDAYYTIVSGFRQNCDRIAIAPLIPDPKHFLIVNTLQTISYSNRQEFLIAIVGLTAKDNISI
jgi:hypothetical protein